MTATGDPDWMYENLMVDVDKINLEAYKPHRHEVKSPLAYREDLVDFFSTDPHKRGLKLPWDNMSEMRIREGELVIYAGANGHGKSALLGQCITQWMRQEGQKFLLVSPEFDPVQNIARLVQQITGLLPGQIREPEINAVLAFLENRLLIYDVVGTTHIDDICAVAYWANIERGVTAVCLDNLTTFRLPDRGDTNVSQQELITQLVEVARNSGMTVHLVAHTRKPAPGEKVSRHMVRGSSTIVDLADVVMVVERNESKEARLADMNTTDEERQEIRMQSDTRLHVLKNRHGNGWLGMGKLYYSPISMRWYDSNRFNDRPFSEITELASLGGPMRSPTI